MVAVTAAETHRDGDAVDLGWWSDGEVVAELVAVRRRIACLEAEAARLVGEVDARGIPAAAGFGSTTGWLMAHTGDPAGVCRSRVRTARALRHMPATRAAFTAGEVTEPRVRLLVAAWDTAPEVFAGHEAMLVDQARTLPAGEVAVAVAAWRRLADHDGYLSDADRGYRRRSLHISRVWDSVRIDGTLDPEAGAVVITALRCLSSPSGSDDTRSATQRRADALTSLCRRHLDTAQRPVIGGDRPHIVVHLDLDSLQGRAGRICDTDSTGAITPAAARRLACDAYITRVITGPDSEILDIGRRSRVIPAGLRRAVMIRDRHCTHPGCDVPAIWCEIHHIIHWADGGPTTLSNLTLLCPRHHHHTHTNPQRE